MKEIYSNKQKIMAGVLLALILVSLLGIAVFAYLKLSGNSAINTMNVAKSVTPIVNGLSGDTIPAKDVQIGVGKTGYSVYVRAAIVYTWVNTDAGDAIPDGNVHASAPAKDTNFKESLNVGDGKDWFLGSDGYYYHRAPVESEGMTSVLINSVTDVTGAPAGYSLKITVIAQTVQTIGKTDSTPEIFAVEDAWKVVTVQDGNLVPKP